MTDQIDKTLEELRAYELTVSNLRAELEEHKRQYDLLLAWKTKGESILQGGPKYVLFRLGAWWADRPWRVRK